MKNLVFAFVLITIASCSETPVKEEKAKSIPALVEGDWLLEFQLTETNSAPVNIVITKKDSAYEVVFINAAEKIKVTDVIIDEDNITIHDSVFNA